MGKGVTIMPRVCILRADLLRFSHLFLTFENEVGPNNFGADRLRLVSQKVKGITNLILRILSER